MSIEIVSGFRRSSRNALLGGRMDKKLFKERGDLRRFEGADLRNLRSV